MTIRLLAALAFATSPALADDFLCSDFAFVTPEAITFVAETGGIAPPPPPRSDIDAVLEAKGGMIWIFSGPKPSEDIQTCLAVTEQRVPGVTELFETIMAGIGQPLSPEALEMRLRPFPEDMHSTLLAQGYGGPVESHGQRIEAGPWASYVLVTTFEEPRRSFGAIETILGGPGPQCTGCIGAFRHFIAE
ncbi:hypothetical protein [Pacificoceanicola onchidii]|uniref:hypothetical protein n=1 Tax=Pacificoceanicola onchidii TaxID=2562685 RepID=UPI0010A69E04|nr:hypothetical protein [Pacificoceanicola onchidii]